MKFFFSFPHPSEDYCSKSEPSNQEKSRHVPLLFGAISEVIFSGQYYGTAERLMIDDCATRR